MALRSIRKEGDEVLRKESKPVTEFNRRLEMLIDDMFETMYDANGCGLAAVAGVASCAACTVCAILQHGAIVGMQNEMLGVSELSPHNGLFVAAYAIISAAAYVVYFRWAASNLGRRREGEAQTSVAQSYGRGTLLASALVLAALFILRFSFYMVHMTVGISL